MSAAATRRARAFCGVPRAPRATSTGAVDLAAPLLPGILQVGWPVRPALLKTSLKSAVVGYLGFFGNCS